MAASGVEWAAIVLFVAGSFAGLLVIPRYWRDEQGQIPRRGTNRWPWSEELRRWWLRSVHLGIIAAALLSTLFVALLAQEVTSGRTAVAVVPLLLAIVAVFTVDVAVLLFNRPAFVVPPHARHEPGAIAARRDRRPPRP